MRGLWRLLVAVVCATAGCRGDRDDGAIRIGAIVSLSGAAGEQGRNWLRGAELAAGELAAQGMSVRLVVEDDETKPARVAAAFQKLVDIDRVGAVMGGTWDYLAQTAYPLAQRHRVPFLTVSNPVELLTEQGKTNPWIFTNGLSLRAEEEAMREFLRAEQIRSLVLIYPNVPFGTTHADLLRRLAGELSIPILESFEFPVEGNYLDAVRLAMLKVEAIRPDLVFAVLDYSGVDLVTGELLRLKTGARLLTTQHLDQAFLLARTPEQYRAAYGVYPRLEDPGFEHRFRERFGEPPRVYAANGYDGLMFLAKALRAGVRLEDPAAHFEYDGVTGRHQLPTPDRGLVRDRALIMTTRSGRFEAWHPPP